MAYAVRNIFTAEVRCACGQGFKNAGAYFRHELLCETHQKGKKVLDKPTDSDQNLATIPINASIPASSPKPVACWCGRRFKDHHALRQHGCYCAARKQQANAQSASWNTSQVINLNLSANSSQAPGEQLPVPPAEFAGKRIQCPCGQSFANGKTLNKHLRYSKTHQIRKPGSLFTSRGKTPCPIPNTVPNSLPVSIAPASGPLPGTIPSSGLLLASLLHCTCGHVFETERSLDLHKRDSLIHKQQADESTTQYKRWDDSLVSSFASMHLESVPNMAIPSVARFTCMCGRTFDNQKALEQHKHNTGQHPLRKKKERRENVFKMPRPQYQEDEYLRDMAAVLARQNHGVE